MSTDLAIRKVISIAVDEVGYLEKNSNKLLEDPKANVGRNNFTKYARDLDRLNFYNGPKNGYSWCAVFVDWCFVQAFGLQNTLKMTGQPIGGYGAGCAESVRYYKALGRFYQYNPQPGDQVFFKGSNGVVAHTGLVCKVAQGKITTVEGNTSGGDGVDANGGGVFAKVYTLSHPKILGYGRPKYDLVAEDFMTGKEIYDAVQEYLKKQPVPDWAKDEFQEAIDLGLTDGSNPCQLVPRYQAVIMAKRALKSKQ